MAIAQRQMRPQQTYMAQQGMNRSGPSGLADVLEVLLDKGLVIDAFVRVSLIGIELLTVDARIVVASVDTYLRFAEAVNRLDLLEANQSQHLGDVIGNRSESSRGRGSGARALSSRGKSSDESDGKEPRGESKQQDGDDSKQDESKQKEMSSSSEGDGADGSPSERQSDDDGDGRGDDKGLLTKLKERGQVF